MVQALCKGTFLTQLGREISELQDKGKIKEDYFATNKNRATLYELLKFLDEEVPDEELFKAMKSIFFTGISKNATKEDEMLAYEFLQTAKKLSGTEVLILKANYQIFKGERNEALGEMNVETVGTHRGNWRRMISKQMGYDELDVVAKYELNLEELGLISPRNEMDRLQAEFDPNHGTAKYRLTKMGQKFCEFIINYTDGLGGS